MIDAESTMTEKEIEKKILKRLESEIVNILLTDHLMTDQQRSDFDAVHRKMFLPKMIAFLKGKTEKTDDEKARLFALENTPRTELQQKTYVNMLRAFINGKVNWLQGKEQRSTYENCVLDALTAVEKTSLFRTHFRCLWCLKKQYPIQFGSKTGFAADIVLLLNNEPIMIVECKRPEVSQTEGKEQLESYLYATTANLGILANNTNPKNWHYYDNSIRFAKIKYSEFWDKIKTAFTTERDIEKEAQQLKQQRIEERAKELVAQATQDINARANRLIDEEAKKRVTQNAVHTAVAKQLQQEKKQLQVQRQNETGQLKSTIDNLRTALAEKDAEAQLLQKIRKAEAQQQKKEKKQLESQLQGKIKRLEHKIGSQQIALDESRNKAILGWVLFGISVIVIFIIAVNI